MSKKFAMIVGTDFEEIEMVSPVDILKRAGMEVDIVSLFNEPIVKGAHNIYFKPDKNFKDFNLNDYDGIMIPGGYGADHGPKQLLMQDNLIELYKKASKDGKVTAAICAAPQVLGKAGILDGKDITHYPGCDQFLDKVGKDESPKALSVIDGQVITGVGPGGAISFGLAIVEHELGKAKAEEVAKAMIYKDQLK